MTWIKPPTVNTVIATLSALAMLYLLLSLSGTVSLTRATSQHVQEQRPAFYLNQVQSHNFNDSGELSTYITGESITQQPTDNSSLLSNPQLDLFAAGKMVWRANADSAKAYSHSDYIQLSGNVKIRTNDGYTVLTTERLAIVADKKIAKTQSPVTLLTPGAVMQSNGLRVDLRSKEIVMTGNIRGQYDAPL